MRLVRYLRDKFEESLVIKATALNIITLLVISLFVIVVFFINSYNYSNEITTMNTKLYINNLRNNLESTMNEEIYHMKTLAKSRRLIDWFKDPSPDKAALLIDENQYSIVNLSMNEIEVNIVKSESSRIVDLSKRNVSEMTTRELVYSANTMNATRLQLEQTPYEYIITSSANALTGVNTIWFVIGVYDEGEFLGSLSFEVDIDEVTFGLSTDNDTTDVFIVDSVGTLKTTSIDDFEYLWTFENLSVTDIIANESFSNYFNTITQQDNFYVNSDEAEVFNINIGENPITAYKNAVVSALPVGGTPWCVVTISELETVGALISYSQIVLYIMLVTVIGAFFLLFWTNTLFKKPLTLFIDSIERAKRDRIAKIYGLERRDEFGYLARNLSFMTNQLTQDIIELEKIISRRTYELKIINFELTSSNIRLEQAYGRLPLPVITFFATGEVLFCNKLACEFIGVNDVNEMRLLLMKRPEYVFVELDFEDVFEKAMSGELKVLETYVKNNNDVFFKVSLEIVFIPVKTEAEKNIFDVFIKVLGKVTDEKELYEITRISNARSAYFDM
ncbi:MAG: hypothetical protein ACK5LV_00360 [Lachnospirales bacterium]